MAEPTIIPGQITRLLDEVEAGREGATEELLQSVYEDLRACAARLLRARPPGHSWSATDLAHEAYIRLCRGHFPTKNRAYFFGVVALAMRNLLYQHGKGRAPGRRVPLDDVLDGFEATQKMGIEDLHEALADMEKLDPRAHQMVMLRVFVGLGVKEVADLLGVAVRTVELDWTWAKSWIYTRLQGDEHGGRRAEGKKYLRGGR